MSPAGEPKDAAATSTAAARESTKDGRSVFWADLKAVFAGRDFRRLFRTRLISQTGDGIITAAVGTYVFFNASTFPSPLAGAAAFAVLYLPYSLVGPFAGVFIDRWSRRQILVWSGLIRAVVVVATAALMVADNRGVPLYIAVLVLLGVNRFLLSSLSAALPHVVAGDTLVMANSASDTLGGIMAALGGIVALGVNAATGDSERGAAVTALIGGACYVAASVAATSLHRHALGPLHEEAHHVRLTADLAEVAASLRDGARYVLRRRAARAALGATGAYSFLFGPLFLMTILLYRNYFYPGHVTVAESHVGELALVSAVGYGCAALLTPIATRRISKRAWIAVMLVLAGLVAGGIGETFSQLGYFAIGFFMYLTRQGVSLGAVTILQEDVADPYRGRVLAFYDMMYNAAYALGAAVLAVFMPANTRSPVIVAVIAAGFLVAAAAYWLVSGDAGPSPSAAAQRSSSAVAPSVPSGPSDSRSSSRNL